MEKRIKELEFDIRRAKGSIETIRRTIASHEAKINELTNMLGDAATQEEKEAIKKEMKKYTDHIKFLEPSIPDLEERIAYSESELVKLQQKGGRKRKSRRKSKRRVSKTRKH
jgi:predicted  nucleic acid-binding Zn-ribbon protein